jgi:hypothetical protein
MFYEYKMEVPELPKGEGLLPEIRKLPQQKMLLPVQKKNNLPPTFILPLTEQPNQLVRKSWKCILSL